MLSKSTKQAKAEVTVKEATEADIPTILGLILELAKFEGKSSAEIGVTEQSIRRYGFGDAKCFHVKLALREEQAIGYALYSIRFSGWKGLPVLYIEDLYVVPEERKNGHGKALLSELSEEARLRGCGFMEWLVFDWNVKALEFYKKMGAVLREDLKLLRFNL